MKHLRTKMRQNWRRVWAADYAGYGTTRTSRPTVNRVTRRRYWREEWRSRQLGEFLP